MTISIERQQSSLEIPAPVLPLYALIKEGVVDPEALCWRLQCSRPGLAKGLAILLHLLLEEAQKEEVTQAAELVHILLTNYENGLTMSENPAPQDAQDEDRPELTERELQVLDGMSHGWSNIEIGKKLYLSEDTVKSHSRKLFRKLGAVDRAHAVALGFRLGFLK